MFPAFNYFQHAEEFALSVDSSENIKKNNNKMISRGVGRFGN